jgi:hypothetical protein
VLELKRSKVERSGVEFVLLISHSTRRLSCPLTVVVVSSGRTGTPVEFGVILILPLSTVNCSSAEDD